MKNYTITVNGNVYDVTVEEGTNSAVAATPVAAPTRPVAPVQQSAPVQPVAQVKAPAPTPVAKPAATAQGGIKVNSPMPGKILGIKVNVGQTVKKGDVILILEAMKMENEIVASSDGTVSTINVSVGASVDAGEVLATLS